MNGKPQFAWELYLKMDSSTESFNLLQLIANDCYKMGSFFYAAKAFDVLERLDPDPEYWEGKRGELCKLPFLDHMAIRMCHNNMHLYVLNVSKSVYNGPNVLYFLVCHRSVCGGVPASDRGCGEQGHAEGGDLSHPKHQQPTGGVYHQNHQEMVLGTRSERVTQTNTSSTTYHTA